jgi:hypothetical protein
MGPRRTDAWSNALVLLSLALACSDNSSNAAPAAGRGSDACHEWQGAYCGLVAKCQAANAACDQIKGIACKSDEEARRCASAINAQSCAAPPAGCDIAGIADPAPAQKACDDFETALCARNEECQPGSRDACLEQIKGQLACANAIGVGLSYEQCLTDVAKISCTVPSTPETCKGVILVSQ